MIAITDLPAEAIWTAGRPLAIAPTSVATAREFAARFLADTAKLGGDHREDVVLVVSEIVTNAMKYGGNGRRNMYLDIEIWSKWTLVTVDDRTPEVYEPAAADDEEDENLRESGRGLQIVDVLAERWWWHPRRISKTANAVILRGNVTLTDQDNDILDRLKADE
jgi:anti-sigma regulatory factor (Ser/Thr protein kinase)